jgi:N-acetylglucosaminyldiphosphoundecaprenol N-acetyl-beta-D-mannosaminyltransferase
MTKQIISLFISTGLYDSFIHRIIELARKKQSSYVCVANVHMTIEAYWDSKFADMVNDADLVTPDGMPLAKAMKLLYGLRQDRVAGMDLLPDLLEKAEKENLGVFFYGGTDEMLQKTKAFVQATYPDLKEQAYYSPPFRALTAEEEVSVIQQINNSGAQLVFVALGCPKQEKWMAGMKGKINACMLGIGGALPVMIGMQKRAPQWMQKLSLEWLVPFNSRTKTTF